MGCACPPATTHTPTLQDPQVIILCLIKHLEKDLPNPYVLVMGFSPRQVHYGFSMTKENNSNMFLG